MGHNSQIYGRPMTRPLQIKGEIKWSLIIAASSSLAIGCSQITGTDPVGCEINGNPRPECLANWVADKKGNLLVVTWPDGDKSTIRPIGSSTIDVLLNEKDRGELIANKGFYQFKSISTGSIISVSPTIAGDTWSPNKINISRIKSQEKRDAENALRATRLKFQESKKREEEAARERRAQQQKAQEVARQREAQQRKEALYQNPIARVSVKQLSEEFESNSIVAEEKYAGQMISVSGIIDSVDDTMFDQNSVTVSLGVPDGYQCFGEFGCTSMPDFSFASVSCSHKRSDPVIRELRKDMKIEVRGIVYSESTGVRLKNCRYYRP